MKVFLLLLVTAILLVTLVAGFLFAFAVVVMPGIRQMGNRGFVEAFQVMDGVIQRNQPLFVLVWLGSIVALVVAAVMGFWQLEGLSRVLLILATLVYLFGVQMPTFTQNVPLNNALQAVNVQKASDVQIQQARAQFESAWNRWNVLRTWLASLAAVLLIVVALRL